MIPPPEDFTRSTVQSELLPVSPCRVGELPAFVESLRCLLQSYTLHAAEIPFLTIFVCRIFDTKTMENLGVGSSTLPVILVPILGP